MTGGGGGFLSSVESLSHLALLVGDLGKSVEFYSKAVGLQVLSTSGPGEPPLVVFREGLGLKPLGAPGVERSGCASRRSIDHLAFKVPDLEVLQSRLSAAGVPIADGPRLSPYGNSVYFLDPDGNKVECHDGEREGGV
jgi:catechol 2,3-dioxygenase-like lactoylglutathione lyase family enzyme